jgi:hypothetical protein
MAMARPPTERSHFAHIIDFPCRSHLHLTGTRPGTPPCSITSGISTRNSRKDHDVIVNVDHGSAFASGAGQTYAKPIV